MIELTMDFNTLVAVWSFIIGIGAFAFIRVKQDKTVVSEGNGKPVSLSRVFDIIKERIKDFQEGPCLSERKNTEKLFEIQQRMYRVELRSAADVLHGEVIQINEALKDGLLTIDKRIDRIENKIDENGKKT